MTARYQRRLSKGSDSVAVPWHFPVETVNRTASLCKPADQRSLANQAIPDSSASGRRHAGPDLYDAGRCVAAYRVAAPTSAFGRDGLLVWVSALDLHKLLTEAVELVRRACLGLVATGVPALRIDRPTVASRQSPFLRFLPPAAFITQSAFRRAVPRPRGRWTSTGSKLAPGACFSSCNAASRRLIAPAGLVPSRRRPWGSALQSFACAERVAFRRCLPFVLFAIRRTSEPVVEPARSL